MHKLHFLNLVVLVFMLFSGGRVIGQSSVKDSTISLFSIEMSFGAHTPAGDLSKRFGESSMIGLGFQYKTKSNWMFGVHGGFVFGNQVKESVAQSIMTSQNFVIDQEGRFTELLVQERGLTTIASVAKVVPVFGPNPNSGFVFRLGGGLLQHKIRLETRNNDVPQLEGDYLKGYDRLSNGFSLYQFVGYQYLSNKKLINFSIGLEGYQGFTKSRRDFNIDLMKKDETKRMDGLYGLKFTWKFLLYKRAASPYYR